MKKLIVILAILLISMPLFAAETAVIKEISGRVEIQNPGGSWQSASAGDMIQKGATISTGFGSMAILEIGASTLTVEAMTRIKLEELVQTQSSQTTGLFLRVGKVKADVNRDAGLTHDFKLRSPSSTAAVRGTAFSFDGKKVTVERGAVALIGNALAREVIVARGETSEVSSNGKTSSPVAEKVKESSTQSDTGKQENSSSQSSASQTSGASAPPAAATGAPAVPSMYGNITITIK